jgi:hypothetical protein
VLNCGLLAADSKVRIYDPTGSEPFLVGPAIAPSVCALMPVGSTQCALLETPQKCSKPCDSGYLVLAWLVLRMLRPTVPLHCMSVELDVARRHLVECLRTKRISLFPYSDLVPAGAAQRQDLPASAQLTFTRERDRLTVRTSTASMALPPVPDAKVPWIQSLNQHPT